MCEVSAECLVPSGLGGGDLDFCQGLGLMGEKLLILKVQMQAEVYQSHEG